MSDEQPGQDEWDFYPCRVDDEPASILINLRFLYEDPRPDNDHVHHAFIRMAETGPQGLGTQSEMDRLTPIEDALCDRAEAAGAEPVGRLRGQGVWQISVYGPASLSWEAWVKELVGADAVVECQPDPEFEYLNDFLLPDAERHQWILDRRVCDQLRQQGDEASLPRPVDHFVEYENEAPAALIEALKGLGFDVTDTGEALECSKVHDVELANVHEITCALTELADEHDAAYSGWGCPVTKPNNQAN
jgi:Regulator of ribonuclease activity B/Family of unknown function (DUF695)